MSKRKESVCGKVRSLSCRGRLFLLAAITSLFAASGGCVTAVKNENEPVFLPLYTVTGSGAAPSEAEALLAALGLRIEPASLPFDADGVLAYVNPDTFQKLPVVSLGAGSVDGDEDPAEQVSCMAFDLDAIGDLAVFDETQALGKTESALDGAGLLPGGFTASVGHTRFEAYETDGTELANKEVDTVVSYEGTLNEVPLVGPGAKIKVTYSGDGTATQVYYAMRRVERGKSIRLVPASRAGDTVRRALKRELRSEGIEGTLALDEPVLVYYAPPLGMQVRSLYPHYRIDGTVTVDGSEVLLRTTYVPAVEGGPAVDLEVRVDFAPLHEQYRVTATASVSGGTPPYAFSWHTTSQGSLPDTGSSVQYPYAFSARGEGVAETVSVVVTDADGLAASAEGRGYPVIDYGIEYPALPSRNSAAPRGIYGDVGDFGADWIGTSHPNPLPGSRLNAQGFLDTLGNAGYTYAFNFGELQAWETDYKDPARAASGQDDAVADSVDMVFYTGHASAAGFAFCGNHDDKLLHYDDALWGNTDLEWIVIAACGPLQNTSAGGGGTMRWLPALGGLHMILAYATTSSDNTIEGSQLASWMLGTRVPGMGPLYVYVSWVLAATASQPSHVRWAVMGPLGPNAENNAYDYYWYKGSVGRDLVGSNILGYWRVSGPS